MDELKPIFEYDDYRKFLRDVYDDLKNRKRGFSYRRFSQMAGFTSPNIFKLVMDGDRNLSPASIEKFTKALRLNKEESWFFKNLVLFNQSKDLAEKQSYAKELTQSRSYRKIFPLNQSQINFLTHWYYIAIWESVGLPGFEESPEFIAKNLHPQILPSQAREALNELIKLGLLERNSNGKLQKTKAVLSTDRITTALLRQAHQEFIKMGSESIDRFSREEREIYAHTFKFNMASVPKIKELVQKFRNDVIDLAQKEPTADTVFQLNLQLFPLAFGPSKKELK